MKVNFLKLVRKAMTPTYGTPGAAAFDIYASKSTIGTEKVIVETGISIEIPPGYEMQIRPRSGLAFKNRVHAFAGTIDSDYRGEIKILLMGESTGQVINVFHGDRIAQGIIRPVEQVEFVQVDELSDTQRGTGGFGSTG
jgi:dUTP pyrophosphatase